MGNRSMIDHEKRRKLSQAIRRLATGQMTNKDFDDLYYEEYESSEDHAVQAIAEYCYSLYSSDTLIPYCLRGRHRVASDVRRTVCRCVLFLRSDLEYEWRRYPSECGRRLLDSLAFSLGLPGSIAVLLICLVLLACHDYALAAYLGIPALAVLVWSVWALFIMPNHDSPETQSWKSTGDREVWPFLRSADLNDVSLRNNG